MRLVADAVRGKSIGEARSKLEFVTKRAVSPIRKLLDSAVANAKNLGLEEKALRVKEIKVDSGKILYRRRPVAHGAAHPVRKRTSHVTLVLEAQDESNKGADKKIKQNNF